MIKKSDLEQIIVKSQSTKINVYREYCQHVFLSSFYQKRGSENLLFKGGTALRIAYGSPRYSEDLDFTLVSLSTHEIEDLVLTTLENIERANLPSEIIESKETSGGYLAKIQINLYEEKVQFIIQASTRKRGNKNMGKPNFQLIQNDFTPPYTIWLLPEAEMVTEKVNAALTRSKPRDFFDIYYLLRHQMIPIDLRSELNKMPKIIKGKEIEFDSLSDFLPQSMFPLAKDFKKIFEGEIERFTG